MPFRISTATRLQITTDRVTTVFRRVGSRFPRTFAPRDGSDLLPLRLPWHCSWVKRFCRPPQSGGFANFATPLVLDAGDALVSVVTYNNITTRTVFFGLASTDEMDIIFGYAY